MNQQNPLDMLRDIHLPGEISAWPPAPGWWFLLIFSILLIIAVFWLLRKNYLQKKLFRLSQSAISELELAYDKHQDPYLLVKEYSSLIRRIALARFPRQQIASLTGKLWLEFLDESAGLSVFNSEAGKLLIHGPYQKSENSVKHLDELKQAIHLWIKAVNLKKQQSLTTENVGSLS